MESDSAAHIQRASGPYSSSTVANFPSSSSSSSRLQDEENNDESQHQHHEQQQPQRFSRISYHLNISIFNVGRINMSDDVWSCMVVLITFWLFASMTMILGYYGSVTLQLGPNCSRLIQTNTFFVQSIKFEEMDKQKSGLVLYGLRGPLSLDVGTSWTETHDAVIPTNLHKDWLFFLNKGSQVNISYNIKSTNSLPLSLVIAKGAESLVEWITDPSYPNLTLSWNIIHGSGRIQQEIPKSSYYYIAVRNLNSEEVEVKLKFSFNAIFYDTSQAYYKCSLGERLCTLELYFLGKNAAVLSSPAGNGDPLNDNYWNVKVSYGPRWITYLVGSGVMTILILLAFRFRKMLQRRDEIEIIVGDSEPERAPLLAPKDDDDISSLGSSYDSASQNEEDLRQWLATTSLDRKHLNEGESNSHLRLCVVCFDAPRDCFFLPCGHCITCFSCGTRIVEDDGCCPICCKKLKKVRKIFTV